MGFFGNAAEGDAKRMMQKQFSLEEQAWQRMLAQQNTAQNAVMPYLSGKEGFDPALLKQMISQFLNQSSRNYQQAGSNVRSALNARGAGGGTEPVGGDYVRGIASLEGARASDVSGGVANINIQNLQTALQNKWNAVNVINGQAAQMSYPLMTFGNATTGALESYVKAGNSGFGSALGEGLGTGLGKGISAFANAGLGKLSSKMGLSAGGQQQGSSGGGSSSGG